ncbi:MAG: acyl-ACP desaturase [Myxococcales bacterium]
MELDKYLDASAQVDTTDLDWELAAKVGLTEDEVFIVTYASDIESQTIFYMRDVLRGQTAMDGGAIGFLSMWNYEEYFHGRALAKLLDACGRPLQQARVADVRKTSRFTEAMEANLIALGAALFPRDFPGIPMCWGASQELTTLRTYELLGSRTRNPVLSTLCERIALQERRHYAWYFNSAREVLSRSAWSRRITRFALETFWSPVGVGVKTEAEMLRLIHLFFPGEAGRQLACEIDGKLGQLPGLEDISLMRKWAARAAEQYGEEPEPEVKAAA